MKPNEIILLKSSLVRQTTCLKSQRNIADDAGHVNASKRHLMSMSLGCLLNLCFSQHSQYLRFLQHFRLLYVQDVSRLPYRTCLSSPDYAQARRVPSRLGTVTIRSIQARAVTLPHINTTMVTERPRPPVSGGGAPRPGFPRSQPSAPSASRASNLGIGLGGKGAAGLGRGKGKGAKRHQ